MEDEISAAWSPRDVVHALYVSARRAPGRTAVSHNGNAMSYAELAAAVRALAERLGPSPGSVAVLVDRSPGTVVAMLGVLAAGGTYCPIDPAFPPVRQRTMLSAAGCESVVVPTSGMAVPGCARPIFLSGMPGSLERLDASLAEFTPPAPDTPAYVLFTSGSTGAPKPVVTPRRAIAAAVESLVGLLGLQPASRTMQFASLNWDTCLEEILPTFSAGATLVLHDEFHTGSFPRMLRAIAAEQVTLLDLPTAFWHELVRHLAECGTGLPDSVRTVVIGGEAAGSAQLAAWRELPTSAVRLVNTYGCTETTLITHAIDLHGPVVHDGPARWSGAGRVPIGRALPHVLEDIGDDGELLVAGPSLASGYRNLPDATASRFITREDGSGPRLWFRTGDRVSRTGDGILRHEGRIDDDIKVRGIRVNPAEVESELIRCPGVSAAAVVGVQAAGRTTMTAYVVAEDTPGPGTAARLIAAELRQRVPEHLVPSQITAVPRLVHTASGKVDRAASHRTYSIPAIQGEE
ncbi:AMP-binding protein [Streptomyces sp. NPDC058612]|uniref:AMP-binding protein n=1 Tax=Streptomyces sp. NPDC058612 TaxID=3346555 RepID=UPI00364F3AF1